MFSSVRHTEHVRNAINIGVHTITVPLKIIKQLTENNFTTVGTEQFIMDTRLMTVRVKEAINTVNPIVSIDTNLTDAIIKMTEFGFGAITVVDANGNIKGVFTDGALRRLLVEKGRDILQKKLSDIEFNEPITIDANVLLNDANTLFKKTNVDTILVTDAGKPIGMLDIQDMKGE
jgi:signal-transduction protein with cAMP-binding, CBS, and nucleotidyltransferase domain